MLSPDDFGYGKKYGWYRPIRSFKVSTLVITDDEYPEETNSPFFHVSNEEHGLIDGDRGILQEVIGMGVPAINLHWRKLAFCET